MNEIEQKIKDYILNEVLPGEDPALLTDSVQLVRGGILDSIATLKLAGFLEEEFHIKLEAHEMSADHLNTIPQIVALVESKQKA
jgi:acyl carrier protein